MYEEFDRLLQAVEVEKKTALGMREYIEGRLFGREVVLVFSQWGKTAAASTTANLINVFAADLVVFTGVAGGLDPRARVTPSGYIRSRFLDDKLSAGMLLELARAVAEGEVKPERKTSLFFSVYEEVGHGASAGIPDDTEDLLVVDMGCVGEGLSCTEQQVSICAKDSSGPYDYAMTGELIDLCQKHQLDYAVDVYPFYGSDAGAALRSGRDIRYALIGAGVYASHGYERSHVKGVENTLRLIEKYVEN